MLTLNKYLYRQMLLIDLGKFLIFNYFFSDWQNILALRSIIRNFIDFLMETYGHNDTNESSDEIMEFRDSLCSVLCELIKK